MTRFSKTFTCQCETGHAFDLTRPSHVFGYKTIEDMGENVNVTVFGKGTFIVPRVFIFFHGVKGKDIETYGFKKYV